MTTTVTEPPTETQAVLEEEKKTYPPIEKVSIICSKGTLDMAYPGLVMANGARMNGIDAMLFFTFWGLDIVTEKKIDNLHVATVGNPKLEIPPVREMIEILHDSGAELYGCRMAMDMFKLERQDLVPQVDEVLTVMDFYDKSAGAQIIFI
jgi:peroxiredoxin family protein